MRTILPRTNAEAGFQIAPMIDVVFVILVFFMALAAQIRIEQILRTRLPGHAATREATEFFDEQILQIGREGEVALNEEIQDAGARGELPSLSATLIRLKAASDAAKSRLVVTLISHPDSSYSRTIDVLNALALAGIVDVTFTSGEAP